MTKKEVFAALEIADHEIRLIVAEWHNLKLNILKVERVETSGVQNTVIVEKNDVVNSIRKAVENASKLIGSEIQRVLVVLPSYHMSRCGKRVTVPTEFGMVTKSDVFNAVKTARDARIPEENEIVNILPRRYIVNGIATTRLPMGEKADSLAVEFEVLSADKQMVYSYLGCVEEAGLQIADICLDAYALALEASLLDNTDEGYTLMVRAERQATTLSLIADHRVLSSTVVDAGFGEIIGKIADEYSLPVDIAGRLLLYNLRLDKKDLPESPIYYWTVNAVPYTLSEKELAEMVAPLVERWIHKLKVVSTDVLATGRVNVVVCGEGAEMQGLDKFLSTELEAPVTVYIPDTLGIRTSAMAACAGSIYAYRDEMAAYLENGVYAFSDETYLNAVKKPEEVKVKQNVNEDTLSNRFKKLFIKG